MNFPIRPAVPSDVEAITEIYNNAVENTVATFDVVPKSVPDRLRWLTERRSDHPVLVAEGNGNITGWASLGAWSDKEAYEGSVEISLYIRAGFEGRGIGRRLSQAIIEEGRNAGLRTILARIAEGNDASMHLCETFGFRYIGVMKEAGFKFGRNLDVHFYQLLLGST